MIEPQRLHTRIWREVPDPDNAFATQEAFCHGYNVYAEMLGRARWTEMLFLLFRGQAPDQGQSELMEALAVALANPGPREPSVQAAMASGTGGAPAAAALMAALAAGAGRFGGARDVLEVMRAMAACQGGMEAWCTGINAAIPEPVRVEIWPARERAAGFEPNGLTTSGIVKQVLEHLAQYEVAKTIHWLRENRGRLEAVAGLPIAMTMVAAAALTDLGFSPEQGEMVFLLLRLPGAAAHAVEQRELGYKLFPFPPVDLQDDPLNREVPA